jgi:hypothetical protein
MKYKEFIENNFLIVDKTDKVVPFVFNDIQNKYLMQDVSGMDIILKARQQGFSSIILARFATDFLIRENSKSIVVADISDNAIDLLERVKFFLKSYEEINKVKIPLKYNSKYEMYNELMNSKYQIGTAENIDFGRSKTITNLHLSEAAFYQHIDKIIAGAMQAVIPEGFTVLETTANGFNDFKKLWDKTEKGETGFKPLFYKASDFYNQEFLDKKKKQLDRLFVQEYPETSIEAFITSGSCFFDTNILKIHLDQITQPIKENLIYV